MIELIYFMGGLVYLTIGILLLIHLNDATNIYSGTEDWAAFVLVYVWPITLTLGWSLHLYRKFKRRRGW